MPELVHRSLSNRRLITLVAVAAMLAALLLIQLPSLLGVKASLKMTLGTPCSSADITGGNQPVQPGDGTVVLTASAQGCLNPDFKFWLLAPGSTTWVAKTGYTASTTYQWVTAAAQLGVWQIGVWARETGYASRYQAYSFRTFTLVDFRCTAADISANPVSPGPGALTTVTFTATATNCAAYFEFWVLSPGSSTWVLEQPYPSTNSPGHELFVWTPPTTPGPYRIGVWARQWQSPRRYDTYAQITYWVVLN
jgi:hypothetical protein